MNQCAICGLPTRLIGLAYECASCNTISYEPAYLHLTSKFDPNTELGWTYKYNGRYDSISNADINFLRNEAERYIDPGFYFEIRAKIPTNYGQDKSLAWYYHPDFWNGNYPRHVGRHNPMLPGVASSYYIAGGYITGVEILQTKPETDEGDCQCKHSWYDHIGWRDHLEGESRLRTNCRIVGCGCEAYLTRLQVGA